MFYLYCPFLVLYNMAERNSLMSILLLGLFILSSVGGDAEAEDIFLTLNCFIKFIQSAFWCFRNLNVMVVKC